MSRRRFCVSVLTVASGLGIALTSATADDAPYARLKALLPPGDEAQACYARTYDAAHLKKHPKQKVTDMVFFLRYSALSEEERALTFSGQHGHDFRYDFTLAAKLRGGAETLYASGECGSTSRIGCGVECDGGGVELDPKADAPGALLVRLDRDYSFIRMTPGCGDEEEDAVTLEAGADDKVFKLTKSPLLLCRSMQENLDKRLEAQSATDD